MPRSPWRDILCKRTSGNRVRSQPVRRLRLNNGRQLNPENRTAAPRSPYTTCPKVLTFTSDVDMSLLSASPPRLTQQRRPPRYRTQQRVRQAIISRNAMRRLASRASYPHECSGPAQQRPQHQRRGFRSVNLRRRINSTNYFVAPAVVKTLEPCNEVLPIGLI